MKGLKATVVIVAGFGWALSLAYGVAWVLAGP